MAKSLVSGAIFFYFNVDGDVSDAYPTAGQRITRTRRSTPPDSQFRHRSRESFS